MMPSSSAPDISETLTISAAGIARAIRHRALVAEYDQASEFPLYSLMSEILNALKLAVDNNDVYALPQPRLIPAAFAWAPQDTFLAPTPDFTFVKEMIKHLGAGVHDIFVKKVLIAMIEIKRLRHDKANIRLDWTKAHDQAVLVFNDSIEQLLLQAFSAFHTFPEQREIYQICECGVFFTLLKFSRTETSLSELPSVPFIEEVAGTGKSSKRRRTNAAPKLTFSQNNINIADVMPLTDVSIMPIICSAPIFSGTPQPDSMEFSSVFRYALSIILGEANVKLAMLSSLFGCEGIPDIDKSELSECETVIHDWYTWHATPPKSPSRASTPAPLPEGRISYAETPKRDPRTNLVIPDTPESPPWDGDDNEEKNLKRRRK